ncbi:putative wall-associated receptor kinase, galacturonan-binding domain-containing protein [Helianthus anomalus]
MLTRYIILLLFIIKTCCFTNTQSQPLPGCQERFGTVTIPYPFGIGPNCSAHNAYSITCNTSFNPPKPFITGINLEALDISLEGTVRVNNPLFNSCNNNSIDHLVVNFTNTPFTYSTTATRFTAIGCNNLVLISGPIRVLGGCVSLCTDTTSDNNCYGVLCCQTNIPPSLRVNGVLPRGEYSPLRNNQSVYSMSTPLLG